MSPPTLLRALVLSCWATAVCARDIFSIPVSNEHSAAPRAGTSCRLLQRDVLVGWRQHARCAQASLRAAGDRIG